ncbi:MAG: hypothetical protein ABJN69_11390 [Hellea sp.]
MADIYQYNWTCKNCGHGNSIDRTKIEAAFDHSPNRAPCTQCGGTDLASAGYSMPEIDEELLEIWYADPALYFMDQDEDLIIAGADLEVLENFLEKNDLKIERAKLMGPIFAIKLYDDNFENSEKRQRCVQWLAQNKEKWVDSIDEYIMRKIKPVLKKETQNDPKRNQN